MLNEKEMFELLTEENKERSKSSLKPYADILKLHREKYPDEAKESDTWREWWKKEFSRLGVPKEEADAFFPALTD